MPAGRYENYGAAGLQPSTGYRGVPFVHRVPAHLTARILRTFNRIIDWQ